MLFVYVLLTAFIQLSCFSPKVCGGVIPESLEVRTHEGVVKGVRLDTETGEGESVIAFLGLHYAENTNFTGTVDDTFGDFWGSDRWNPSEDSPMTRDCLALNIWIPNDSIDDPHTVMVWIHGGAFSSGSASLPLYDGRVLASKMNVIVIGINYRLGPFGFLAFQYAFQPVVSGNVGFQDQALALTWIKNNIAGFGGDPSRITVWGESAGAAAAMFQTIKSKELLSGGVLQSGSTLNNWACTYRDEMSQRSKLLSKSLNCFDPMKPTRNTTHILSCLSTKSSERTVQLAASQQARIMIPNFVPICDQTSTKSIAQRVLKGDVTDSPILIGFNRDEGSFLLPYIFPDYFPFNPRTPGGENEKQETVPSLNFAGYYRVVEKLFQDYYNNNSVLYGIAMHYSLFGGRPYGESVLRIFDDFFMSCPILKTINILEQQGKTVYRYYYTYESDGNPWPGWMGVLHGEELPLLFGYPLGNASHSQLYSHRDRLHSMQIMKFWTNFAKNGNPSTSDFEWPKGRFVELREGGPFVRDSVPLDCQFWEQLDNSIPCKKNPYDWMCKAVKNEFDPENQTEPPLPEEKEVEEGTTEGNVVDTTTPSTESSTSASNSTTPANSSETETTETITTVSSRGIRPPLDQLLYAIIVVLLFCFVL